MTVSTFILALFALALNSSLQCNARKLLMEGKKTTEKSKGNILVDWANRLRTKQKEEEEAKAAAKARGQGVLQIFVSSPGQETGPICIELPSNAMVNDLKTAIAEKGREVGLLAIGGKPLTEGALSDSGISSEAVIENTVESVIFTAVIPIKRFDGWRAKKLVVKCYGLMRADLTTQQIIDKMIQAIQNEFGEFDVIQAIKNESYNQLMHIGTHVAEDQLNVVLDEVRIQLHTLDRHYSGVIDVRGGYGVPPRFIPLSRVQAKDLQLLLSGNLTPEQLEANLYS